MKIRAFLAFELPEDFRLLLIQIFRYFTVSFRGAYPLEKQQKLHITVKFLGDLTENKIADLSVALKKSIRAPAFVIDVNEFGYFGSKEETTILWAGADFRPSLDHYIREVNSVLRDCNLPKIDNGYKPHITLMRVRKKLPEEFLDKFLSLDVTNLNTEIRSFVLYESKLLKSGSVYKPLLKVR